MHQFGLIATRRVFFDCPLRIRRAAPVRPSSCRTILCCAVAAPDSVEPSQTRLTSRETPDQIQFSKKSSKMTYLVSLCSSTLCSRICRARAKKRLWPPREYAALALRLIILLKDHCILRHYVMDVKSICRCCSIAEARLLGSPQLSTFLASTAVLAQKTHHSAQVLFWAFLLGIVPPMNVFNLRVRHQSGQQLATGDTIGIVDANNHE